MPIPHHLTLHHHSLSFDLFHGDPSFALIHVLFHFRNRFFWCGTCNLRSFQSVSEEKWESWHQFSDLLYLQRKTVGYHVRGHGQLQLELPSLFWDLQSFLPAYQSPASMFYKNPHLCSPPNMYALSIRILRNSFNAEILAGGSGWARQMFPIAFMDHSKNGSTSIPDQLLHKCSYNLGPWAKYNFLPLNQGHHFFLEFPNRQWIWSRWKLQRIVSFMVFFVAQKLFWSPNFPENSPHPPPQNAPHKKIRGKKTGKNGEDAQNAFVFFWQRSWSQSNGCWTYFLGGFRCFSSGKKKTDWND